MLGGADGVREEMVVRESDGGVGRLSWVGERM